MTTTLRSIFVVTLTIALPLAGPALAQPVNDNCEDATAISGFQVHFYDATQASTDGLPHSLCNAFGSSQIFNDVWYCWTAGISGPVGARTCGGCFMDTRLAVYAGCGCPEGNGILACNDDDCDLQSDVQWNAVAGQTYLIRAGTFDMFDFDSCNVEIYANTVPTEAGPFTDPATDHTYFLLTGSSWTAAEATAVIMGGHLATVEDAAENEFIRASVLGFDGADRRGWLGLNDFASEGNFVWSSGSTAPFRNWSGGEPNDSGGVEDAVEMFGSNGAWNDNRDQPLGLIVQGVVEIEPAPGCPGDFNNSGNVDLNDLTLLLSSFGTSSGATFGDMDGDGDVDLSDLTAFLSVFGLPCP